MDNGELGRKLRSARKRRGLTLREVADRSLDLTMNGVARVERGERWPNLITLQGLCDALGVRITIYPRKRLDVTPVEQFLPETTEEDGDENRNADSSPA